MPGTRAGLLGILGFTVLGFREEVFFGALGFFRVLGGSLPGTRAGSQGLGQFRVFGF